MLLYIYCKTKPLKKCVNKFACNNYKYNYRMWKLIRFNIWQKSRFSAYIPQNGGVADLIFLIIMHLKKIYRCRSFLSRGQPFSACLSVSHSRIRTAAVDLLWSGS